MFDREIARIFNVSKVLEDLHKAIEEERKAIDPTDHPRTPEDVLKMGVICVSLMLIISILVISVSSAIAIASIFLTIAVVQMFAYAYMRESEMPTFNPKVIVFTFLLTVSLALLALASLVIA